MQDKATQPLPDPPDGEAKEDNAGPEGTKQPEEAKEVIKESEQAELQIGLL